jgi:tetraacyldisaccharide 4'-kinase
MQPRHRFSFFIAKISSLLTACRHALEHRIMQMWESRCFWAWLLFPVSLLFASLASLRRLSFTWKCRAVERLRVPVIVVGNVRVGGTGKTPIVIALVAALRAAGWRPGVISRGYGVQFTGTRCVQIQDMPHQVGDEPLLIAKRTQAPVYIGVDRVAAGHALCAAHPDVNVLISDDGLQHYRLARDIELIVFDERLGGNGFLLPAGPLREPLHRRRDATLLNQNESISPSASAMQLQQLRQENGLAVDAPIFAVPLKTGLAWRLMNPLEQRALHTFVDQKVGAVAGIGAPERFFDGLRKQGVALVSTQALPDHFAYSVTTFSQIDAQVILITEKDAVKCEAIFAEQPDARLWVVPVDAVLEPRCIDFVMDKLRSLTE